MNLAFKDLTNGEQSNDDSMWQLVDERDFDKLNFTRSHSCSELFKRNNRDICMGILSVKILDLIFRTMSEVTTDHSIPQPLNRKFVHQAETLASLTQLLML